CGVTGGTPGPAGSPPPGCGAAGPVSGTVVKLSFTPVMPPAPSPPGRGSFSRQTSLPQAPDTPEFADSWGLSGPPGITGARPPSPAGSSPWASSGFSGYVGPGVSSLTFGDEGRPRCGASGGGTHSPSPALTSVPRVSAASSGVGYLERFDLCNALAVI